MFISNISVPGFLFTSLLIFFSFRLLRYISKKIIDNESLKQRVKKTLFSLELLIWLLLIAQIAEYSIINKPVLAIILVVLLIFITSWTFWYIIRDYIAGIYIRLSGSFKLHETISFTQLNPTEFIKGKIVQFTDRYIILERTDYSLLQIPYNKLYNTKIERSVKSAQEELHLSIEIKNNKGEQEIKKALKTKLLQLPWVNHNHDIKIDFKKEDNLTRSIELKVVLLDKKYRQSVSDILIKSFQK